MYKLIAMLSYNDIVTVLCCGDICVRTEGEHFQNSKMCFHTVYQTTIKNRIKIKTLKTKKKIRD